MAVNTDHQLQKLQMLSKKITKGILPDGSSLPDDYREQLLDRIDWVTTIYIHQDSIPYCFSHALNQLAVILGFVGFLGPDEEF